MIVIQLIKNEFDLGGMQQVDAIKPRTIQAVQV